MSALPVARRQGPRQVDSGGGCQGQLVKVQVESPPSTPALPGAVGGRLDPEKPRPYIPGAAYASHLNPPVEGLC